MEGKIFKQVKRKNRLRESIADASYGSDGIVAEFGAEVGDINVNDVGIAEEVVPPDVLEDLVTGEDVRSVRN